jgi:anaerobic selenocysteine-containing dehydrogenase/Fe-S-cluster-containing dehydrogenase component
MSDGLSRRSFLKLAATAGAAAAIPGCEPAARKLIPYVVPDENVIPGVPTYFATTCSECPAGCGVIAKVMEGRVIKLEGNPSDPISQGAICARGQGALQGLYNPDRVAKPERRETDGRLHPIEWDDATKLLNDRLAAAAKAGKNRVAFFGTSQGPTLDSITRQWLEAFNSTLAVFWEPFTEEAARSAAEALFGRRDLPVYKFDQAETIISFGADFTETWGSPVEYARQFAEFRAPKMRKGQLSVGHTAYVGPRMNATAAKCDEWLAANPGTEGAVAMAVLHEVLAQGWAANNGGADIDGLKTFVAGYDPEQVSAAAGVSADAIKRIAQWFGQADGAVAVAGTQDPQNHIAALILNSITGNIGRTTIFLEDAPAEATSRPAEVQAFLNALNGGEIDVLIIAGGNPSYSMPRSYAFNAAIQRAGFVVWMHDMRDETAAVGHLLLPVHHPLESWRDSAPRAGVFGLGQPVMQPVYASRQLHDVLIESAHLGAPQSSQSLTYENAAEAIESSWQELHGKLGGSQTSANFWAQARRQGGVFQQAKPSDLNLSTSNLKAAPVPKTPAARGLVLWTYPHLFLYDGRGANKPWLQEIPDPVTQIVWDNWAEIHPDTAAQLGLKQDYENTRLYAGINIIEISTPAGSVEIATTISSVVKPGVIAMPFGQGHTDYGRYANGIGVNPWSFMPAGTSYVPVSVRVTEKEHKLVTPLGKSDMMGRSIIEACTLDQLISGKMPIPSDVEVVDPSLPQEMYDPFVYPGHKWGMTIDVNSCTGCSACVAACYAENNVQVVGRQNVSIGRIMSWLRIERYFPHPGEEAPPLYIAPILCYQCDHAPCEPVCPVFAAHHTPEGLNAQIYNRCIGTRFCENNCPYKVRRFNWYGGEWEYPLNYQLNPDVTVRGAGVMEKCTFCVQRITNAEIDARTEKRAVVDGEIIPACAQACPSRAITFGDINDPNSAMMKRRADHKVRNYTMLPEYNALPNVTYLRDIYQTKGKA